MNQHDRNPGSPAGDRTRPIGTDPDFSAVESVIPNTRYQVPAPIRAIFTLLSRLWPALAARIAARLFCTPMRGQLRPAEEPVMARAGRFSLEVAGQQVVGYSWGEGPVVMLLHGWGSRTSRLAQLVDPLTAAGFRVVGFDAPAHGESEGRTTTGVYYARALRAVADQVGPLTAIVTHSMGGWVASLALRQGLEVQRLVFLAPPDDMQYYSDLFARQAGFTIPVQERAEANLAAETGVEWARLGPDEIYGGFDLPLLIVHDSDDPVSPVDQAERVHRAWQGSELMITKGLGHRRIVTDPAVIARVIAFLSEDPSP